MRKLLLLFAFLLVIILSVFFNSASARDFPNNIQGTWQIQDYAGSVYGSHFDTVCGKIRVPVTKYFLNDFEFYISQEEDGSFSFLGREGGEVVGRYFEGGLDFVFPDKDLKLSGLLSPNDEVIFVEGTYEACGWISFAVSFEMRYLGLNVN